MKNRFDEPEGYDTLHVEPEWCEDCSTECEESGIEYEFNYIIQDGVAYCESCRMPL